MEDRPYSRLEHHRAIVKTNLRTTALHLYGKRVNQELLVVNYGTALVALGVRGCGHTRNYLPVVASIA
jgi:hypothetical protein